MLLLDQNQTASAVSLVTLNNFGQQAIAAAETALAQAMAALNLARQKTRVMERLKSRAAQRYQLEVTREDNRTMDAFAAIRYAARQREGDARDD